MYICHQIDATHTGLLPYFYNMYKDKNAAISCAIFCRIERSFIFLLKKNHTILLLLLLLFLLSIIHSILFISTCHSEHISYLRFICHLKINSQLVRNLLSRLSAPFNIHVVYWVLKPIQDSLTVFVPTITANIQSYPSLLSKDNITEPVSFACQT